MMVHLRPRFIVLKSWMRRYGFGVLRSSIQLPIFHTLITVYASGRDQAWLNGTVCLNARLAPLSSATDTFNCLLDEHILLTLLELYVKAQVINC